MSRNIDKNAVCPFFVEESGCANMPDKIKEGHKLLCSCRIRCEGLVPGSKLFLEFNSHTERNEHKDNFCYDRCWEGCPVAQILLEQYGLKINNDGTMRLAT